MRARCDSALDITIGRLSIVCKEETWNLETVRSLAETQYILLVLDSGGLGDTSTIFRELKG